MTGHAIEFYARLWVRRILRHHPMAAELHKLVLAGPRLLAKVVDSRGNMLAYVQRWPRDGEQAAVHATGQRLLKAIEREWGKNVWGMGDKAA